MIVNKNAGHCVPLEIPENSQPLTGIRPRKTTKNRDNDESQPLPVITSNQSQLLSGIDSNPSQPKSGNDILDKLEDLVNY